MTSRALLAAFLSGVAALICEIAWVRPLTLLVGDTAFAVALILSVFFAGMAIGSAVAGRWAPRVASPLRVCAWLQLVIGALVALSLPVLSMSLPMHAVIVRAVGQWIDLPLGIAFAALTLLFPTALMGATTPLLIQGLARLSPSPETRIAARVYAWNTFGGVFGASLAGLVLVPLLGLRLSGGLAGILNLAAMALLLFAKQGNAHKKTEEEEPDLPRVRFSAIVTIAAISGFVALGSEVLWTRMLSSAITNSSSSFALIVACVLLGLTLGAWVVARLDFATRWVPLVTLQLFIALALSLSGLFHSNLMLLGATLRVWFNLNGLVGGFIAEFMLAMTLAFLPAVLMGINLPLIFAAWPGAAHTSGRRWGNLLAVNTMAAVAGSVVTATVLIPLVHTRGALAILAALSAMSGLYLWQASSPARVGQRFTVAACMAAVIVAMVLTPGHVPLAPSQTLLSRTDGIGATVSVMESATGVRSMLINDRYVVGTTGGRQLELRQAIIPTLLHPNPRRIFHLGMGTGHTAGALATSPGLERLVTCDNLPGVIDAARDWFSDTNLSLFDNPKAEIVCADGRHWLETTDETFDLIVIDNLLPWLSGAGELHSREFYELLHDHLAEGGIACIWLPAHQIDQRLLNLVSDTVNDVFPSVHLWLTLPVPESSIGLIASDNPISLTHMLSDERFSDPRWRTVMADARVTGPADIFAGLTGLSTESAERRAISTDNWPVFEWWALENFQVNMAPYPEIYSSPAAAGIWSAMCETRRQGAAELRHGLGLDGELPDAVRAIAIRVWNRWQNLTDLVNGLVALTHGDDRVETMCLQALGRDPEDPNAQMQTEWLIGVLNRGKQWRAAADLGEDANAIFDLSDEAKVQWASSMIDSGRHYRARRTLERLFEENPDNIEAGVALIRAYQVQEMPDAAEQVLDQLRESHPDHPWIRELHLEETHDDHAGHDHEDH